MTQRECERCEEDFDFLFPSLEGMLCFDCQTELEDEMESGTALEE